MLMEYQNTVADPLDDHLAGLTDNQIPLENKPHVDNLELDQWELDWGHEYTLK